MRDDKELMARRGFLRDVRIMYGLTVGEVANRTGLAKATVSRLERGKQGFSVNSAMKIAAAYDLDLEHLLGEPKKGAKRKTGRKTKGLRGKKNGR